MPEFICHNLYVIIYMSQFICHNFAEYITNTFRAVKYTLQNEMENGPNHYTGLHFIPMEK